MTRGFLTIAYGPSRYIDMAESLARSLRLHNPSVVLAVVTDSSSPRLRKLFNHVIPIEARFGDGVSQKLHVDRYTPFNETLFIDSDSLAFANPESLWQMYADSAGFGVKGWAYLGPEDSHYGIIDLRRTLRLLRVDRIGAFNTGLFYFDKSQASQAVFATARELAKRAPELGFAPFKSSPCADEPVFALALELTGNPMLEWDDGRAMCTASGDNLQGLDDINVLSGKVTLIRYETPTQPVILHFHMHAQQAFAYRREQWRLRLGVRVGATYLASICAAPAYAAAQCGRLWTRAASRFRSHGTTGLLPERLLARLRGTEADRSTKT